MKNQSDIFSVKNHTIQVTTLFIHCIWIDVYYFGIHLVKNYRKDNVRTQKMLLSFCETIKEARILQNSSLTGLNII